DGADEEVTFSFVASGSSGTLAGITSNNEAINWSSDGTTITGVTATSGDTVFELRFDSNGDLIFDLDDQVDHSFGSAGTDDELLANKIDVGQFIVATDFDGDWVTLDGQLLVDVENDVPTIGDVSHAYIANEPGLDLVGIIDIDSGADEPVTADLTANIEGWDGTTTTSVEVEGLFSNSQQVYYYVDPLATNVLHAITDPANPGGSIVFTLTVDPLTDSYELETFAKLDAITDYDFDSSEAGFPNGPKPELVITEDPVTGEHNAYEPADVPSDVDILFSLTSRDSGGAASTVNGSTDGMGIQNNVVNDGEGVLVIDFGLTDSFSGGTADVVAVGEVTLAGRVVGSNEPLIIEYTAFNEFGDAVDLDGNVITDGSPTGTETFAIGENPIITFNTDGGIDAISKVEIEAVQNDFKLTDVDFAISSSEQDIYEEFQVDIVDADGDVATDTIYVEFDGDNVMVGTDGGDVFAGGPEAETIYGEGGDDVIDGGGGDDILIGGDGADEIYGGDGDDTIVADSVTVYGDPDVSGDTVIVEDGDVDIVVGGDGGETSGDVVPDNTGSDPDTFSGIDVDSEDLDNLVPPPTDTP
ncbi:DUF5801 repeats-in-toxin domain-containing protein, partial [Desulforhopalus singaporensis]